MRQSCPQLLFFTMVGIIGGAGCTGRVTGAAAEQLGQTENAVSITPASVTICQWNTIAELLRVPDAVGEHVVYGCTACADTNTFCAIPASTYDSSDQSGNSLIFFLVDGMAGFLRVSPNVEAPRMIFFHEGGAACGQGTADTSLTSVLQDRGFQTVSVEYMLGYLALDSTGNPLYCSGWFTRTSAAPVTLGQLARRPGALIHWAHDHLSRGRPFAVSGDSGGAVATFAARYFVEDFDSFVDYELFTGGPGAWDLEALCKVPNEVSGVPHYCNENINATCTKDSDCTGSATDRCMSMYDLGTTFEVFKAIIDYANYDASAHCQHGQMSAALDNSSPRKTTGHNANRHKLDFIICDEDLDAGLAANAGQIFHQLTGTRDWYDFGNCAHSAEIESPNLQPITTGIVAVGMAPYAGVVQGNLLIQPGSHLDRWDGDVIIVPGADSGTIQGSLAVQP
jgi:hypothetical protein